MDTHSSRKRPAPATLRNRGPIEGVLRELLPDRGAVLEIASGSGEHAVHFAAAFPRILWQPSDADPDCLASIMAWSEEAALPNLRSPWALDVRATPWPSLAAGDRRAGDMRADTMAGDFDAVISSNMIHIA